MSADDFPDLATEAFSETKDMGGWRSCIQQHGCQNLVTLGWTFCPACEQHFERSFWQFEWLSLSWCDDETLQRLFFPNTCDEKYTNQKGFQVLGHPMPSIGVYSSTCSQWGVGKWQNLWCGKQHDRCMAGDGQERGCRRYQLYPDNGQFFHLCKGNWRERPLREGVVLLGLQEHRQVCLVPS